MSASGPGITVTGADERTPIEELVRLTRLSPHVEIGILFSLTPEGRNRYPSCCWIDDAINALGKRCAIHVCGTRARQIALRHSYALSSAGRVQVNGVVSPEELHRLLYVLPRVITQHNPGWGYDLSHTNVPGTHQLLVDASGGRGISPREWRRPETDKAVGFAGGLGPDNLAAELRRLQAVARNPWWVDMEGKLRTSDDWFSVDLAERAIQVFLQETAAMREDHD